MRTLLQEGVQVLESFSGHQGPGSSAHSWGQGRLGPICLMKIHRRGKKPQDKTFKIKEWIDHQQKTKWKEMGWKSGATDFSL